MANKLKSDELIDLEIFIAQDEKESISYKNSRDAKFYSEAPEYAKKNEISFLRYWVESMRKTSSSVSAGRIAEGAFLFVSIILFLIGAFAIGRPISNAFFIKAGDAESINVAWFAISCIAIPLFLFFSAIFFAPKLGFFIDAFIAWILKIFSKEKASFQAVYTQNKKWILLKGALTAQFLGLGVAFGIFFSQLFSQMFNEYKYSLETTLPSIVTDEAVYESTKFMSLPWRYVWGETKSYPSLEQVALSRAGNQNDPEATQSFEVWANFFIMCSLFYGVFLRILFFIFTKYRIGKCFGLHRILNDRKINDIIKRMAFAAGNPNLNFAFKNRENAEVLLLLRQDFMPFKNTIMQITKEVLQKEDINIFEYAFSDELFSDTFDSLAKRHKIFSIFHLSDDYNEEVFEVIENLVNKYPEKFINIHILGRYDKADEKFLNPPAVEKSWWERKINSVSTRNLKLF